MNSRNSVLLIEDDHQTRVLLRQALECEGYDVLSAANGRDGLDLLQREDTLAPSLVLLDMRMPIVNGDEVIRAIRHDMKLYQTPIVVISAHARPKEAAMTHGFIPKPLNLDDVLATVERFCAA